MVAKGQCFGHGFIDPGAKDLVHGFRTLAHPNVPHVNDLGRDGLKEGANFFKGSQAASHHDRQGAMSSSFDAAGHRGIEKIGTRTTHHPRCKLRGVRTDG